MINLTKVSFGGASAIVTSLGLIVGAAAAQTSRAALLEALLIVALADNLTDALGIHIYQESEKLEAQHAFAATIGNFATRLATCGTFLLLLTALPDSYTVSGSVAWGLSLLGGLTWLVARDRGANPITEVGKHLAIALLVIAMSVGIGAIIHDIAFNTPLELPWDVSPNAPPTARD